MTSPMLQTNRELNSHQLHDLVQVVSHLSGCLRTATPWDDSSPKPQLDGGVRASLEATMINACSRIDALLADDSRWTVPLEDVQTDFRAHLLTQISLLRSQGLDAELKREIALAHIFGPEDIEFVPEPAPKKPTRRRKKGNDGK